MRGASWGQLRLILWNLRFMVKWCLIFEQVLTETLYGHYEKIVFGKCLHYHTQQFKCMCVYVCVLPKVQMWSPLGDVCLGTGDSKAISAERVWSGTGGRRMLSAMCMRASYDSKDLVWVLRKDNHTCSYKAIFHLQTPSKVRRTQCQSSLVPTLVLTSPCLPASNLGGPGQPSK